MALGITGLNRRFTFKHGTETVTLTDPDLSMSPEAVMNFYANTYPELTTATANGPRIEDDEAVYEFRTTIGTKG